MYGWRARIGLLIPSSNTTMEAEFWEMCPKGVSVHTSRMPLKEVTEDALLEMEKESLQGASLLKDADVNLIVYGCTSGSLIKGPGYDKEISRKIEEKTGIRTITTSTAVLEALKKVNAKRICVATPYIREVNEREREFLEGNGFEVLRILGLGIKENLEIGRQPSWRAYEIGKKAFDPKADALFISCTNFRTIDVIDLLEEDLGIPVITSNQASMWYSLKTLGISEKYDRFGSLMKEL